MSVSTIKKIQCKDYSIFFNDWNQMSDYIEKGNYSNVTCIVDENTHEHCLPILEQMIDGQLGVIIINAGEKYKTIDTCTKIWNEMMLLGLDRHSLTITLGGGVVGDIGGFCAATFMRGMAYIHVPTTLLSQVDSSVGGKLGVDLDGYKNMIGLIQNPKDVYIFPQFIKSLHNRDLFSGFAEMIKHALISDRSLWDQIRAINPLLHTDWTEDIYKSIQVKSVITELDPLEKSIRKKLNFGHTLGHAIESENLKKEDPLLHGEAIAIGMVLESHISFQKGFLRKCDLEEITQCILELYDFHPEALSNKSEIIEYTKKDKKNKGNTTRSTLLKDIGHAVIDQAISEKEILNAIAYYIDQ